MKAINGKVLLEKVEQETGGIIVERTIDRGRVVSSGTDLVKKGDIVIFRQYQELDGLLLVDESDLLAIIDG